MKIVKRLEDLFFSWHCVLSLGSMNSKGWVLSHFLPPADFSAFHCYSDFVGVLNIYSLLDNDSLISFTKCT